MDKEAIRQAAKNLGLPKREVYNEYNRITEEGDTYEKIILEIKDELIQIRRKIHSNPSWALKNMKPPPLRTI